MKRAPAALALALVAAAVAGCLAEDSDPAPLPTLDETPSGAAVVGDRNAVTAEALAATPSYFLTGHAGAEPNMGITSTGAIFVSAFSNILRSQDGGATWEIVQTHDPLPNSDPMMWVDPWTDCIYNAPMFPILLGATLYQSCDDGDTWTPIHSQNLGRGVYDHQKLASAPPGPDALPVVGLVAPTAFIICYNALVATNCAVSYDGGITWPHDVPIWTAVQGPACAGQQSHPTGRDDGVMVVAKAWGCAEPLVFVSTDSGLTWVMRPGPVGVGADTLDPEIAFSSDGAMYMLWQSRTEESHAYLARSDDLGVTWAGPWNVTPPGMNATIFAALAGGDAGRVAMAFHATNHTGDPNQVADDAVWHTYFVWSENADRDAPTFVSRRIQDDPVQIGPICNGNRGCHDGDRNLLDFIDGAVAPDGTFYAVIADGCVGTCADGTEATMTNSRGREAALARLDGWSLFGTETG